MGLSIDIAIEHEAWRALGDIDALAERAVAAALEAGRLATSDGAELSLVLCDDAFIQGLNRQWRGKDKPTNVLSFPAAPETQAIAVGDVIVAYETTAREAVDHGMVLADYVTHLIVHGVLHLFGFDHEQADEAAAMEALESRALAALGIASPYEDLEDLQAAP